MSVCVVILCAATMVRHVVSMAGEEGGGAMSSREKVNVSPFVTSQVTSTLSSPSR